jgi:FSR family fosmidomycin resistance protein-like MFS transporter
MRSLSSIWSRSGAPATLAFLNVGHTYAHLFMLLYPTAVLALEGTWGLGYAELLPLGFAGYLLFGLGSLPAGWLGDRWNSTSMMALFFLGTGASSVLTGLAIGPWTLAAGLTLIGIFASIYHPVGIAWLVGASDRPGRLLGINGVFGAIGTGGAALVAGLLCDLISWRAAFILPGLLCLGTGFAFALGVWHGRLEMVRADYRPNEARPSAEQARRGLFMLFGSILFAGLIFQMTSVGMPKIFQDRLGDVIGSSATAAGALVSVVYLISALGQIGGGYLADRYEERWLYGLSYAVQVGVLVVAALTFNLALFALVAIAATVQTGTQPVENCLIARYTPQHWRATVYGLKFVLALGLSALGVPLVALIYGQTGSFTGVFLAMAAFCVVPIAVGLWLPRRAPAALHPSAEPAE